MSIWREIRCDAVPESADCLSASNNGPKGFESDKELRAEARREGWVFHGGSAYCPKCRK